MRPALVALDVDGTITDADHALSERTLAILSRLRTAGVACVIVTGRAERSAVGIARSVGFTAPVISCNGALVTDPVTSERLWLRHMDPLVALRAVRTARECRCDEQSGPPMPGSWKPRVPPANCLQYFSANSLVCSRWRR